MDALQNFFSGLNDLYTKQRELSAIWLEKPLQTATERTCRIAPDALVKVKDGRLVDCDDHPTHKVIGCIGAMYNQFEFTLIDLLTNEPSQLKL